MIRKIKSELDPLTRELAEKFSRMKSLPGERTRKPSRLRFFEVRLERKTFNSPTWSKAVIAGAEGEWRADGQHTSHVLANCPEALFPADLPVTVNTYQMDSMADAPDLFDLFDNPMAARTNVDKIGVYVAGYSDLALMDHAFLTKITRGLDYYYRDLSKERLEKESSEQQTILLYIAREHGLYFKDDSHRVFTRWLHVWCESKHGWMIGKPGLLAEMFADWKTHSELATRFWGEVMMESNPDPDDETRELSRKLKDWSRKQPMIKQDRFRSQAKKIFERYRRMMLQPELNKEDQPEPELSVSPAVYGVDEGGLQPYV
jgi:hypothetical protein